MTHLPDFLRSRARTSGVEESDRTARRGRGKPHGLGALGLLCTWLGWVAWFGLDESLAHRGFGLLGNRPPEEARFLRLAAIGLGFAQFLFASMAMALGWIAEQRAGPQESGEWLGVLAFRLGGVLLVLLLLRLWVGG